jgi:hypothetical protein
MKIVILGYRVRNHTPQSRFGQFAFDGACRFQIKAPCNCFGTGMGLEILHFAIGVFQPLIFSECACAL